MLSKRRLNEFKDKWSFGWKTSGSYKISRKDIKNLPKHKAVSKDIRDYLNSYKKWFVTLIQESTTKESNSEYCPISCSI